MIDIKSHRMSKRCSIYFNTSCQLKCPFCIALIPNMVEPYVYSGNGKKLPITKIKIGDELLAVDKQGKLTATKVTNINKRYVTELIKIRYATNKFLYVTSEHPFFVIGQGWTKAQNIKKDDILFHVLSSELTQHRMKLCNPMKNKDIVKKVMANRDNIAIGKKISETRLSKFKNGEIIPMMTLLKQNNPKAYDALRQNLSKRMLGKNNSYYKIKDIVKWKENISKAGKGMIRSDISKFRYRLSKLGDKNPMKRLEVRLKSASARRVLPSYPEKTCDEWFKELEFPIQYVGNRKFWVTRKGKDICMNPDFVVKGTKKAIEVYQGKSYNRATNGYVEKRTQNYHDCGWECLFIDFNDKNKDEILLRTREFISNGHKVLSVKKIISGQSFIFVGRKTNIKRKIMFDKTEVINFSCSPHEVYFVNSLLVHNCYFINSLNTTPPIPLDEAKRKLDKAKNYYGLEYLDISGGEATLYPYINEVLKYSKKIGIKLCLITNGINTKKIEELIDLGLDDILLSIEGMGFTHNEMVGSKVWDKVFTTMEMLSRKKYQFRTNTVITKINNNELGELADFLFMYPVKQINLIPFNPHSAVQWTNADKVPFQIKYSEMLPNIKEVIKLATANDVWVNVRYFPLCIGKGIEKHIVNFKQICYDEFDWCGWFEWNKTIEQINELAMREDDDVYGEIGTYERACNIVMKDITKDNTKEQSCKSCENYYICDGIIPQYARNFGFDEFLPIKGVKIRNPNYHREGGK